VSWRVRLYVDLALILAPLVSLAGIVGILLALGV
jgi:hypothetical protein